MPRSLIYLSSCAIHPDGAPDPFMLQEQPWLTEHFERVQMVSHYGVAELTSKGVDLPLARTGLAGLRAFLRAPFTRDFWQEARRLGKARRLTPINLLKLFLFTQRGIQMHLWTERLLQGQNESQTTLYSCWMSFDGYAAALSKRKHPRLRFVARGHAFDVDEERNPMNPFLMKQMIAAQADGLYLISQAAKKQFLAYMEGLVDKKKLWVLAMGSGGAPIEKFRPAPRFAQGIFRVISCAALIPIKQVPVLVDALAAWTGGPLHWTHIGGGENEEAFRRLVSEKLDSKDNVLYELMGNVSSEEVNQVYEKRAFDAFINTSRKEGVPVSVMEAMRYGIPSIAPAVGGIPELITPETGFLYDPAQGPGGVLDCLNRLAAMGEEDTQRMRRAAAKRWNDCYCSLTLLPQLFPSVAKRKGRE